MKLKKKKLKNKTLSHKSIKDKQLVLQFKKHFKKFNKNLSQPKENLMLDWVNKIMAVKTLMIIKR